MKLPIYILLLLTMISTSTVYAQTQRGKATYYSKRATGARTASGEKLHHDSMTCAHRSYPFGTLLKVTNLSNDKSVIVRVTDRGPFRKGTIIDLSWGAAKEIGMLARGIQSVKVEVVDETIIPFRSPQKFSVPAFEVADIEPEFIQWENNKKNVNKKNEVHKVVKSNKPSVHKEVRKETPKEVNKEVHKTSTHK